MSVELIESGSIPDTTFTEFGEFDPICNEGVPERGKVGWQTIRYPDGTEVEFVQKISVSQDEAGWWVVWQVMANGLELDAGNVENVTFNTQDDAWYRSASHCAVDFDQLQQGGYIEKYPQLRGASWR